MSENKLKNHSKSAIASLIFLIVFAVFALFVYIGCLADLIPKNAMRYMIKIFLYVTMGEMWNLMSGYTGITSLGEQLFIGIAGYTLAVVTSYYNMSLGLGLIAGLVINIILASVLALFLFRIEGMYYTIATWIVAEAFMLVFLGWDFVGMGSGMTIRFTQYPAIGDICILAFTVCLGALASVFIILRSRIGIGLTAMRDNIKAAAAAGVNIVAYRFFSYVLAAAFIGLAGGIFFVNKGVIYPENGFSINWMVSMVFIVVIGGSGTVTGPIIGSVIYVLLDEYLAHFPGWSNIILGVITILVILFIPRGISGTIRDKTGINLFSERKRYH